MLRESQPCGFVNEHFFETSAWLHGAWGNNYGINSIAFHHALEND
jgi:hypothetical protein